LVSSAFCKLGVPGYIASIENHARRQTGRLAIAQRKPCPAALDCEFGNAEPKPASNGGLVAPPKETLSHMANSPAGIPGPSSSIAISIVSPSAPHVKWRSQEGFEQQA
jgi:hypothetical protein